MQPGRFSSLIDAPWTDGAVDLTSHIHVAAVSVQSHVSSDVLSSCKRHAAVYLVSKKAFRYWEE